MFKKEESQFDLRTPANFLRAEYDFRAYDRGTGRVYNINSSRFSDAGTQGKKTFKHRQEIDDFLDHLVFLRYARGSWWMILYENNHLSYEDRVNYTLNGKPFTLALGKQQIATLIEQQQLAVYIIPEFIPPDDRNHHRAPAASALIEDDSPEVYTAYSTPFREEEEVQGSAGDSVIGSTTGVGEGVPNRGQLIGDAKTLLPDELDFVQKQLNLGKKVEVIPISKVEGERTADFLIDGQRIELKTVSGIKDTSPGGLSGSIASRIIDARGQSGDIVINAPNQSGLTQEIADRAIRRAFGADTKQGINSIRIIGSDFELFVPRKMP
ncbi:MAG: hypothetical protein AAFZ92_09355 [Pseudomonadota bacterium]